MRQTSDASTFPVEKRNQMPYNYRVAGLKYAAGTAQVAPEAGLK
jgi:hypothetical protein